MNRGATTILLPFLFFCLTACGPAVFKGGKGDRRAGLITGTAHRLDLNRARYLKNEIRILDQGAPGKLSPASSWKINRNRRELEGMADDLTECGRWAIAKGDLDLAGQCLDIAAEIKPSAEINVLIEKMKSGRKKQTIIPANRAVGGVRGVTEGKIKSAIAEGRLEMAMKYTAARQAMGLPVPPGLAEQLALKIRIRVENRLKKARDFYSRGAMNNAEDLWREVLALDRENQEANNGLARLRRVRQRLEHLK